MSLPFLQWLQQWGLLHDNKDGKDAFTCQCWPCMSYSAHGVQHITIPCMMHRFQPDVHSLRLCYGHCDDSHVSHVLAILIVEVWQRVAW